MSTETATYTLRCHCGTHKITLDNIPPITKAIKCNCSICTDRGNLITFVSKDKIIFTDGQGPDSDTLTTYVFNKKVLEWKFCKLCGSTIFAIGKEHPQWGVNVRCVEGVDLDKLEMTPYDGKNSA
ncbi:glutathione-dependent formaldehyde-activating protein [Wilcoxina mikolae CBS 423.85]|nr:glutathione-dependent formaldehyde-activating protein [Wilcoxina mikolae CBS 423.85]